MAIRSTYGEDPQQFGVLRLPVGPGRHPIVALIHGGFWRSRFDLELMTPLATDLLARGFATWNVEYRSVGHAGGGYPGTLEDLGAAIDHLAQLGPEHKLDLAGLAVVGHSAGGHLALWSGSRHLLGPDAPGANPDIVPSLVVGQAPVTDMLAAGSLNLGDGAAVDLMGGTPEELPDEYAVAQPRFDGTVAATIIVGTNDDRVPREFSLPTKDEPIEGAPVEIVTIDGADHFDMIDPTHAAWHAVVDCVRGSSPILDG